MMKAVSMLAAALARHRPTFINGGIGFATFCLGDVIAQGAHLQVDQKVSNLSWRGIMQRSRNVDFERSAKVGLLGVALNGVVLGTWYRVLDKYLGSNRQSTRSLLSKCVADQMVYAPFSITSFVSYAAALNGGGAERIVGEIRSTMRETFLTTWLMDWKIWPAANLVMFRFIPSSYRPSCASMVQLVWQTYLSSVTFNPHAAGATSPTSAAVTVSTTAGAAQGVRGGWEGVGTIPTSILSDNASVSIPSLPSSSSTEGDRAALGARYRRRTTRYAYQPGASGGKKLTRDGSTASAVSIHDAAAAAGQAQRRNSQTGRFSSRDKEL